jgi:aryl-alcohol dehydrogenase-like predicted oxidoreductase
MKYKLLGNSGLRVSELALGTMTFGDDWGWGASKEVSKKIFDSFVDRGGNFIDTANYYTNGTSEKFVGEFIKEDRDRFVVTTKYSLFMDRNNINSGGNHRKSLVSSIKKSLDRLHLDYVDLLLLHAWDSLTPIEEVMRALDDIVRDGKALYIGISDTPAWIVAQGQTLAKERGWTSFINLQVQYSLIERAVERDLLPMANKLGLGVTSWGPIGSGILSGKYSKPISDAEERRLKDDNPRLNEKNMSIVKEVQNIADQLGTSSAQVALRWVMDQNTIPIIGSRKYDQVTDNMGCLEVSLSPDQLTLLNEVSKIQLGFPHDFLQSEGVKDILYGGFYDKIEK